jgi:hypothetical protein
MKRRRSTIIAGLLAAISLACSQSAGPTSPPGDNPPTACATDLSCPFGQECDGTSCAPLGPTLQPHIQTASALLRSYQDDSELAWRATHYDLVIGQANADALRASNPHIRVFEYLNTRYLVHDTEAAAWADANGHDVEDFYLHYREDTTVPTWETTVLVPGYPAGVAPGWNPGGANATATSREQSRVVGFYQGIPTPWHLANVDHPGYRGFLAVHARELIDGSFWFNTYATGPIDGVMCDNAIYYPLFQEGKIDRSDEYYALPMTDDHAYALAYETLYPELAEEMLDAFGSTRDIMPNYGHVMFLNYPNRSAQNVQATTPWIWGEVWVTYNGLASPTTGGSRCITWEKDYANAVRAIVEQTRAGGRRIVGARDTAAGSTGTDRGKLFTLGLYYLVHNAHTYYMYETGTGHANGAHLSTWAWNPAVEYNIGQPDQIPGGAVDFAGNSNTKEHWVFATGPDPFNPALTYRVLARRFTNALVLVKMLPEGSVIDDRSITIHALGESYAVLQADGNPGDVVTHAVLRNNEAMILVK